MAKEGLILAPIFGNGMILQRETHNCIYGTDNRAEIVSLSFIGQEFSTKVEENGDFYIDIPPVKAGGPYSMTIKGSENIEIHDILFGDVYLLAGQSNMELPVRRVLDVSADEISKTHEPDIRQYLLPATFQFLEPKKYMYDGSWKKATDDELMGFSAVGYFFAKEIKETYQVPVGLILAAVGGSKIESWMSQDLVKEIGEYDEVVDDFYDIKYFEEYIKHQQEQASQWLLKLEKEEAKINSLDDHKKWNTCMVPSLVSDYEKTPFSGSVYLCKEVILDEEQKDDNAGIYMGTIIDSDQIWINGTLIGRTEYRYPPRKYPIPKGVLKKGTNKILVRIVINDKNGGMIKGRPYYLNYNNEKISLEGQWHYQIGKKADIPMPAVLFPPSLSTGLYNTAIYPLSKVSLKGILWYQGEANTHNPFGYADKFAKMLTSWRRLFGREIPCIYVQLPNYSEPLNPVADSGWAELRNEQYKSLSLRKVAMAVGMDLGEYNDLHPQNKKGIGVRTALAARHLIYQEENIGYSGPIPKEGIIEGKEIIISFCHLEDGDVKQSINNFEVAGEDGIFYPGNALRTGNKVSIICDKVDKPLHVRYAWCDNPRDINFYNACGLPAAGFCMDF